MSVPKRRHRRCALAALVLGAILLTAGAARAGESLSLSAGQTVYTPVYSHILFGDRATKFNLAATLSIRNTDPDQAISILSADYHDSAGRLVKRHLAQPVLLGPLAATEVFVPERDTSGGFGASFMVSWSSEKPVSPPIVECVMIGARSGQGISIIGPGRVVRNTPR